MEYTGEMKEPKTKHGRRTISLPGFVIEALEAHRREQLEQRFALGLGRPGPEDLVFTLPDGTPWTPDYLSRCWRRATIARGLLVRCFQNNAPMSSGCIVDFVTPGVDDGLAIDVGNEGGQAFVKFVFGADADVAQDRTREL